MIIYCHMWLQAIREMQEQAGFKLGAAGWKKPVYHRATVPFKLAIFLLFHLPDAEVLFNLIS